MSRVTYLIVTMSRVTYLIVTMSRVTCLIPRTTREIALARTNTVKTYCGRAYGEQIKKANGLGRWTRKKYPAVDDDEVMLNVLGCRLTY